MIADLIVALPQDPPRFVENFAKPEHVHVDGPGQLLELASDFGHVDGLFYFTYVVCIVFFVLITGVLGYSVVKYRRKTWDQPAASNVTHNTPLEVVWTVIPLIIVMVMFAWGWKGSLDMTVVPAEARQYKAVARQWNWTYYYPGSPITSLNELWLEKDVPAAFTLQSMDVLHAFFIPAMRVKRDVVPGRQQTLWFRPVKEGDFNLFCAEYCGKDHSKMHTLVHVVTKEKYAEEPWAKLPKDPVLAGEMVYKGACISCHLLDGTPSTGPSWKGLFKKEGDNIVGQEHDIITDKGERKTIVVDEAYIRESIKTPAAKKLADPRYANANMSAFPDLDEARITGLIAFMKSLADKK